MKHLFPLLFIALFLICPLRAQENPLLESSEMESVVQTLLDLPDLQWIYHPELKERLPVKLLASGGINKHLTLTKFNQKVQILSADELKEKGTTDYVELQQLERRGDTLYFTLSYKLEGAGAKGKLLKVKGRWSVVEHHVWEN